MLNRTILTTIAAIICSVVLIVGLTNIVIDPYIKATNWGVNLFEFYEKNKEIDKIYFLGDSITVLGVDPVVVENSLLLNNLSFNVYSIAYPQDLPLNRIFELPNIAMSKPKIMVICFENSWLWPHDDFLSLQQNQQDGYAEKRFLMASDKIEIEPYAQSLFNETELDQVKIDPLHLIADKRRFFIQAIQLKLSNMGLINYKLEKASFDLFDFKNQIETTNKSVEPFKAPCWYNLSKKDNRDRKCFRYIINYLKDHDIHVILVSMPLYPGIEKCKNNPTIFQDFVNSMDCPYYDLESLCSEGEFQDPIHTNYAGRRNITSKMTEILLAEAKNVSK